MASTPNMIPDLILEQYVLGELDQKTSSALETQIEQNIQLAQRVNEIRESNAKILDRYPSKQFASLVEHKLSPNKTISRKIYWISPIIAATTALLVLFVWPHNHNDKHSQIAPEVIRTKGLKPHLQLYKLEHDNIIRIHPKQLLTAGDVIQISYIASKAKHGAIFSIDGRGTITLHFPEQKSNSTKLHGKREVPLPHSYELDDAPAFEQFFFIHSEEPINIEQILKTATHLSKQQILNGQVPTEEKQQISTFLITKGVSL